MKKFMKKIKRKFLRRLFNTCLVLGLALFLSGVPSFAAEKVYFYHTDAAGTPMAMTDASGNVVWEADYKPFGEEYTVTAFPENNKKFIGKEKDEETGLYYFGARYMDAGIGRFTKPDPVGPVDPKTGKESDKLLLNPQGLNRYIYALNNPYRYTDPWGLIWETVGYEYPRSKNYLRYLWNRFVRGWSTKIEKQDAEGTRRYVIQKWRHDPKHPERDKEYPLHTRRRISQENIFYIRYPGEEVIVQDIDKDYYLQWTPWAESPTYEDYPNVKFENLYFWRQGRPSVESTTSKDNPNKKKLKSLFR